MFKHARFPVKGKPLGIFLYTRKFLTSTGYVKYAAGGCPDTDCDWHNKQNSNETENKEGKEDRESWKVEENRIKRRKKRLKMMVL